MKKHFLTGLILLLPFALTVFIVQLIVDILTSPFENLVVALLKHYDIFDQPLLIFSGEQVVQFSSKILILCAIFGITVAIGFFAKKVFVKTILVYSDLLLHRIPFYNKLYKATQDVVRTFLSPKGQSFSQVVLIPFPYASTHSIGLTTVAPGAKTGADLVSIYIPAAPNPTFGLVIVYKYEELIFIDMKVDEALKYIVSCGIMFPERNPLLK
jgi:uncharacterized membrane protein